MSVYIYTRPPTPPVYGRSHHGAGVLMGVREEEHDNDNREMVTDEPADAGHRYGCESPEEGSKSDSDKNVHPQPRQRIGT